MKIWQLNDWNIRGLNIIDVNHPKIINEKDVLIQIKAASLNYRDLIMINGGYGSIGGKLPIIPLSDASGVVIETGSSVESLDIGDIVIPSFFQTWEDGSPSNATMGSSLGGPLDGVMQNYMILSEDGLVKTTNKHLSYSELSTLPCAGVTAWESLVTVGKINEHSKVLIQGTGGVALISLQIAKAKGAEVIVISSSEKKLELLRKLGADYLINYKKELDWFKKVLDYTDGSGVDLVIELGGANTFKNSLKSIKIGGIIALIGVLGGVVAELPIGLAITKSAKIHSITCGPKKSLIELNKFLITKNINPILDSSFSFDDLISATKYMAQAKHIGKIIVKGL